jgi:hypothetical protein
MNSHDVAADVCCMVEGSQVEGGGGMSNLAAQARLFDGEKPMWDGWGYEADLEIHQGCTDAPPLFVLHKTGRSPRWVH